MDAIKTSAYLPKRDPSGPFMFSVDHCFSIRGQGTVMTGTVLSGSVAVGDVSSLGTTVGIALLARFYEFQ
jgi:selenocysteine-specific elongation factor